MSHKVVTLVCSRIVGSAAQKAVLVNMADKASDGGEGVFASKATIAAETEMGLTTVKRAINELVEKGLIVEAGHRACTNGHTVVYDMVIGAISALPEWKPARRSLRTPSRADPVQSGRGPERTVTPSRADPHPVQSGPLTILEPSLNQGGGEEGARAKPDAAPSLVSRLAEALGFNSPKGSGWPKYWVAADAHLIVARWGTDLGLTDDEVIEVATANARQHGSPANGPKTLTRHMQDFAAAKNAPPLEIPAQPTGGQTYDRQSASDRREAAAADRLRREIDVAARMRRPSQGDMP